MANNLTDGIMNDVYLSQEGIDNWGNQFGSYNSIFPLSNAMPTLASTPTCEASSYYGYYTANWPLSLGLDPTPWKVRPGDCACNYANEAYNRWFSNEDYVKRKFGVPGNASVEHYPLGATCGKNCSCGYSAKLKQEGLFGEQENAYLLDGNEATLRM